MNFLLDYTGSSSSESENCGDNATAINEKAAGTPKLPTPSFGSSTVAVTNSVFSNPYVEEEQAKKALLEKHVKMVVPPEQLSMINGKKICLSYRRGRCRFGAQCKFAHDSDLQVTPEADDKNKLAAVTHHSSEPQSAKNHDTSVDKQDGHNWDEETNRKKLKRPGLSAGIIPSKKALKMYHDLKDKNKC